MKTLHTVADIRRALEPHHRRSTIALVPTMGALHAGHVALFDAARRACDVVVVSVFVNPSQFSDPADLARYPHNEAHDERLAAGAGVDLCFAPSVDELYPSGYATWVDVDGPAQDLEGARRPGHFRGVATICAKLFNIVAPRVAFFGQKDAQQVAVVRRLVRDLNIDVEIRVVPIVRDLDGLALSSRNVHLSAEERARAIAIPRALDAGLTAFRDHRDPVAAARAVLSDLPGVDIDYIAVADFEGQPTLAIAARVGETRLIDNAPLTPEGLEGAGSPGHHVSLERTSR
jgi:pantoate--beta-alanine ligase